MNGIVIIVGLALLLSLAVTAGVMLESECHRRKRERLDARVWELWRWERELAAECRDCPTRQLRRRQADLQRSPSDGPDAA